MPKTPKVKLTYLNKRVKGDATRLALIIGGIPFEDERISYEEVARRRETKELPFGQVPVMDIGDGQGNYAQSGALLRWAGRQGGLYPDEHMLLCDSVVETIAEMWPEVIKIGYGSAMMRNPITAVPMVPLSSQQRLEQRTMCRDLLFPVRFQQLEALLQKSSGTFFCGSQITIADVAVYSMASQILAGYWAGNGITPEVLSKCPKIIQLAKHIDAFPAVQAAIQ